MPCDLWKAMSTGFGISIWNVITAPIPLCLPYGMTYLRDICTATHDGTQTFCGYSRLVGVLGASLGSTGTVAPRFCLLFGRRPKGSASFSHLLLNHEE